MNTKKYKQLIAAALFLAGNKGVNIFDLKRLTDQTLNSKEIDEIINEINSFWKKNEFTPFKIRKFNALYKMTTISSLFEDLKKIIKINYSSALSPLLIETLAIIAYNHPVCTKKKIEHIRQTDPTHTINKLLNLELIQINNPDSPQNQAKEYKLTNKSFDLLGIKNIGELPKLSKKYQKHFKQFLDNDKEKDESMNIFYSQEEK